MNNSSRFFLSRGEEEEDFDRLMIESPVKILLLHPPHWYEELAEALEALAILQANTQLAASAFVELLIYNLVLVDLATATAQASLVSNIRLQYPKTRLTVVPDVASAIENIKLQLQVQTLEQELEQTKEMLVVRNAVAWMAMNTAHWRHTIQGHAINIVDEVALLRRLFRQGAKKERIPQKLAKIERLAKLIQTKPISAPLLSQEAVKSVGINAFCEQRVQQLQKNSLYRSVGYQFELTMDNSVTVSINPDWLRCVFDILLENALEAVSQAAIKGITITTHLDSGWVTISVSDTGGGVPIAIRSKLLREPTSRNGNGLGMGLLNARTIIEYYGGELKLMFTSERGTTMMIRLPQEH